MAETTVLKVLLHCDGCVAKVKRHLKRLQGVDAFHVDQKNSKVTVFGSVKPEVVLETVLKAGKTAEFWPQPPPPAPAPAPEAEAPVREPTAKEPAAKEPAVKEPAAKELAVKEPANEPSKETAPKKVVTNWATAGRSRQIKKIVVETEDNAQSMVDAVEMDEFGEDRENDPVFVDAVNHDMQQQEPLENPKKGSGGALKSLGGNNYNKLISESSAALGSGKKHHNHQNGIQKHQTAGGSIGASQGGGGKKNKSSAQILNSNKALGSIAKMGGSPTRF